MVFLPILATRSGDCIMSKILRSLKSIDSLAISGAVRTADALNFQKTIAEKIIQNKQIIG